VPATILAHLWGAPSAYLRRLQAGADRINLAGELSGLVTEDEAAQARTKLVKIGERMAQEASQPAGNGKAEEPPASSSPSAKRAVPRRLSSLADLGSVWRARQAKTVPP
jgi:sRNA-binding protein